ncbi:MAG: tRNA preQ1(34) S-adenosylmethionine ribosyltransferase-isomerase QueA [Alphaproteobacteria bacterium]|nr:tRNA preQ1(34) S-adenosylmethionine ribosyltransferase-isomerase QueA [Alphaproteobacteria bacterium]
MYKTSDFSYDLPKNLIATHPLEQRDASRMLVVRGRAHEDKYVKDFVDFLRRGDVVVFNNSRVIPSRFIADGKHEITLHTATSDGCWWGMCAKFKKIKPGRILYLDDGTMVGVVAQNIKSGLKLKFIAKNTFDVLDRVGKLPLPPYMNRKEEIEDRDRYQTVYSSPLGSMAAPTAGLHFTPQLLEEIEKRGAKIVNVTLHVGAGTWMPVRTEKLDEHKMHSEWGQITEEQAKIINGAKRVIAVGTTSLRLLESAAIYNTDPEQYKRVAPFSRSTRLFITPGYRFRAVDVLFTNFHLPKSTLFILVSAFAGLHEMKLAYSHAIKEKYRFFSYGDSCWLFKKDPTKSSRRKRSRWRAIPESVRKNKRFGKKHFGKR